MYFPTFPYILLDLLVPFFFPGCLTNPMALTSTYKQVTLESSLQLRLLTPPQAHMWNYQLDISAWMIHRKQRFNVPKPLLIIFLLKRALVLFCRQYISFHLSLHLWSSHNFLGLYITLKIISTHDSSKILLFLWPHFHKLTLVFPYPRMPLLCFWHSDLPQPSESTYI